MSKNESGKGRTIAGALSAFSGFTIRTFLINAILMLIFLAVIAFNFSSFYNVQFVTSLSFEANAKRRRLLMVCTSFLISI